PGGTTASGSGTATSSAAPVTTSPPAASPAPPAEAGAPEATTAQPAASSSSAAAAPPPGKWPEATNPDRVVALDRGQGLGGGAVPGARLRGVGGTAAETRLLATQVENELRVVCSGLARDLGNQGTFASSPVACQAALDALKDVRTKLWPAAKIVVRVHP